MSEKIWLIWLNCKDWDNSTRHLIFEIKSEIFWTKSILEIKWTESCIIFFNKIYNIFYNFSFLQHILVVSVTIQHIQAHSNIFRHIQTYSNIFWLPSSQSNMTSLRTWCCSETTRESSNSSTLASQVRLCQALR